MISQILTHNWLRDVFIALLFAASFGAQQAGAATGRTVGQFDVSQTGEQTYSIPIVVPPGVKGLAPELELIYEHRRLSRLSGVGWTISGLSTINRCPRTVAQDGAADEIQLTTADRFCLDGNRLRLATGTTYGGNNTTYRLQIDVAARVTVMGLGTAGDPQWFKVEHKDGMIYEYGNSADSRIESIATGFGATAYIWALTRMKDREGNTILFTYEEDAAPNGEYRIKQIDYTSNSGTGSTAAYRVSVVYETKPSGDKSANSRYLGGGQLKNNKRINRIDVTHVPSSALVRRYELTYPASLSQTGYSVLESVQECAGSPLDCYSATVFSYSSVTLGVGGQIPSSATSIPFTIDINGDGRTDLVWFSASTSTWWYQFGTATGGFTTAVNTSISNLSSVSAMAIDFNQDGKDDILGVNGTTWWVARGSVSGLLAPINTGTAVCAAPCNPIALDFNGDGRDDVVWSTLNQFLVKYRNSSGNGFASTATTLYTACTNCRIGGMGLDKTTRRRNIDVNGDGIRDLVFHQNEFFGPGNPNQYHDINVLLGGGKGVSGIAVGVTDTMMLPGDFNGDGYDDIASSDGTNLYYRLGTGKSFAAAVVAGPLVGTSAAVRDWNSDGFDDVLVAQSSNNTWVVYLSNGSGLGPATSTGIPTGGAAGAVPLDVNGDGLDDFGALKSNGSFVAWVRNGPAPDLMTSVVDGYGNTIATAYKSIAQGAYTPGTGAVFPNVDFTGPVIVPHEVTFSDGVGGTYKKIFAYSDAEVEILSDWQGGLTGSSITPTPNPAPARGLAGALRDAGNVNQTQFKGFGTIKVTDDRDDLVTITTYNQGDLPFNGMVTSQGLYRPNGTQPINTSSMTLGSVTGGTGFNNYALPYVDVTVAREYEVQGVYDTALKSTTTTTVNAIDAYGTVTDFTTLAEEPASGANGVQAGVTYTSRTILTLLPNNVATWCLGKPDEIETRGSHTASADGAQISRYRTQSWDTSSLCRLDSEVFEPNKPAYALTRTLAYDAYGNVTSETLNGRKNATVFENRQTQIEYIIGATEPGRLPVKVTNAADEITTLGWDWAKGLLSNRTDPNGVAVSWTYDYLSRLTSETRAVDGTSTSWTLSPCASVGSGCINSNNRMGSTPILRTLSLRLILSRRSVHVEAQALQP